MDNNTSSIDSNKILGGIKSFNKSDVCFNILYETGEKALLFILNNHVFRYQMSPNGTFPEYPKPNNPEDKAKINAKRVSDYGSEAFDNSHSTEVDNNFIVHTDKINIKFDKEKGTLKVYDKRSNKLVLKESVPLSYKASESIQTLHQHKDEYFFGGGMQNGKFSHKGEIINIVNSNNWVDGGVTSPCPFYWSTYGYGILRNTWQPGTYDFGQHSHEFIQTTHDEEEFDAFYFINQEPKDILNDYYELTGQPIMLPEYAFYEAHLNAFNRDYWVKVDKNTSGSILFEDGEYYKSYQPSQIGDKNGILESLNGEKNNYQFSARAMIDRYKRHDMPLGWFIPNDGYGSGYGQTDTLDGDIENLKDFADYSKKYGVEVALWTESNLSPKDPEYPRKGERDLGKEVGVAGVVALKCDVAWIGAGYSFGLNAVEKATNIFVQHTKNNLRPVIIMVDGWAGTHRYSGIWSGDQVGGEWEYIRFHIPTYTGTGLSGQPIVGSDMDGIFGGQNKEVNIRDFQWKTFTPIQLNMDGWGKTQKTPFSFDREATNINRAYLKLKSMLMPYNYTIGHESIKGLPMVRAMFLEFPKPIASYTNISKYQFMWGPNLLIAPIYNGFKKNNISIRNFIYLPNHNQVWIDIFTGKKYQGGKILNNMKCPLWKIPVFVKDGSVIPMTKANNNPYEIERDYRIFTIYPNGKTIFEVYEDDGISTGYLENHSATTEIVVHGPKSNDIGDLFIAVNETKGHYKTMVNERNTLIQIMTSERPENVKLAVNGESIQIIEVKNNNEFEVKENVYYFKEDFVINTYLQVSSDDLKQKFLLIKLKKYNVTQSNIQIKVKGFTNRSKVFGRETSFNIELNPPIDLFVKEDDVTPSTIKINWISAANAAYYEIEAGDNILTNIIGTSFDFVDLKYNSEHTFRIRSVNSKGFSEWSNILNVKTKEDLFIKGVTVSCSLPCQPSQEICMLTDGHPNSLWHTNWGESGIAKPDQGECLKLSFDLGAVYGMDKIEYIPREDAGNGTILALQYSSSLDNKNWTELSETIHWDHDNATKIISMDGTKMRYINISISNSIGGFGSGKQMLFYKKVE